VAGRDRLGPGAAELVLLTHGVALLHPEEQVLAAMLQGWSNQQLARRLGAATVASRGRQVRAFAAHAQAYPWLWTAQLLDDWMTDLRAVRGLRASSLRGYQIAVRLFCAYLTDPAYGWADECERRFGTHPVQVVHDWNTAVHVQDAESDPSRRAFTRDELQTFFDHADDQVERIRTAGRKGWLAAFRDATLFKVAYAFGLRRNETSMLDVADFGPNPRAVEFGGYGVCYVRHGKAMAGSPPKRRSVLAVWPWSSEILDEWITTVRPLTGARGDALWPTGTRRPGRAVPDQPPLRRLPRTARPPRRAGLPFAAPLLRHAPDRRRMGRAVRPTPSRARARLHDRDLHLRVLGLPHPHTAHRA
jgi:integrase/recombinase XerC